MCLCHDVNGITCDVGRPTWDYVFWVKGRTHLHGFSFGLNDGCATCQRSTQYTFQDGCGVRAHEGHINSGGFLAWLTAVHSRFVDWLDEQFAVSYWDARRYHSLSRHFGGAWQSLSKRLACRKRALSPCAVRSVNVGGKGHCDHKIAWKTQEVATDWQTIRWLHNGIRTCTGFCLLTSPKTHADTLRRQGLLD